MPVAAGREPLHLHPAAVTARGVSACQVGRGGLGYGTFRTTSLEAALGPSAL
jgi:hypothetical protein